MDIPARTSPQGHPQKNIPTRTSLQGNPQKDILLNKSQNGHPWKDIPARKSQKGHPKKDIPTRTPQQGYHGKDIPARKSLQWHPHKEIPERTSLQEYLCNDFPGRKSLQRYHHKDIPSCQYIYLPRAAVRKTHISSIDTDRACLMGSQTNLKSPDRLVKGQKQSHWGTKYCQPLPKKARKSQISQKNKPKKTETFLKSFKTCLMPLNPFHYFYMFSSKKTPTPSISKGGMGIATPPISTSSKKFPPLDTHSSKIFLTPDNHKTNLYTLNDITDWKNRGTVDITDGKN